MRIGMTALLEPSSGVGPGRGPNITSSVALGPPRVYLTSASDQAPDAVLLRVIVGRYARPSLALVPAGVLFHMHRRVGGSGLLVRSHGTCGEPVERGLKLVDGGGTSSRKALLVRQVGPVVCMCYSGA